LEAEVGIGEEIKGKVIRAKGETDFSQRDVGNYEGP